MRDEMDALVGAAARINDADVEALSLRSAEADLMEEIMSTPALETVGSGEPPRRRWASGRRLAAIAGVAAVTIAAAFVIQSSRDTGSVWAASTVAVADKAPRLLVDDADWEMISADVQSGSGVAGFGNGSATLYVEWASATDYKALADFLRSDAEGTEPTAVLGHDAELFHHVHQPDPELDDVPQSSVTPGPTGEMSDSLAGEYRIEPEPEEPPDSWEPPAPPEDSHRFTTIWRQDGYVMQAIMRDVADRAEYDSAIGALQEVDVDTWLGALPDDVVGPDDLKGVVAELMADVPLPAGVDKESLVDSNRISYRHFIGHELTNSVACTWIGQWIEAQESGDDAAAEEAAAALGTAREWTLVQGMRELGEPEDILVDYADAIANEGKLYDEMNVVNVYIDTGESMDTGETVEYNGKEDPEGTFRALFNCDSPSR